MVTWIDMDPRQTPMRPAQTHLRLNLQGAVS